MPRFAVRSLQRDVLCLRENRIAAQFATRKKVRDGLATPQNAGVVTMALPTQNAGGLRFAVTSKC